VKKSTRLLELDSSKLSTSSPASQKAPLASIERFFSPPSQTMHIQAFNEGFQVPLQGREKNIGDYNADYFDSQKATLFTSTFNYDDLEGDEFLHEDYKSDDSMDLEEYWWLEQCLYNVENFYKKIALEGGKAEKEDGNERIASLVEKCRGGRPSFVTPTGS
jgi:hypothetical protein